MPPPEHPAAWWARHWPDVLIVTALALATFVVHPVAYVLHHPYWSDEAWVAVLSKAPLGQWLSLSSSTPLGWLLLVRLVPAGRDGLRLVPLVFAAATVVMAFEAETWRRVRALRPDIRAGALYSGRALTSGAAVSRALSDARAAGVGFVGLAYALVSPEVVAEARRAGVLLGAWTVNEPDAMRMLIERGIGVLITDRPDLAKDALTQRRTP